MASILSSCSFSFLCFNLLSHSLTLSYTPSLHTLHFFIKVYARLGSWFSVTNSKTWLDLGFSLERNGLLQNFTEEKYQLMRDQVPWRGAVRSTPASCRSLLSPLLVREILSWTGNLAQVSPLLFSYEFIFQLVSSFLSILHAFIFYSFLLICIPFPYVRLIHLGLSWKRPPHCRSRERF